MPHHFVEKETLIRANKAIGLGLVWAGLVACLVAAIVHDVGRWFDAW
ncbi:hypothetical protein A33M_3662 [Rhodovulum sp. PH10]|nr:hypothetical protein [Rhodovulum sp. PH10]EJW11017.1 hypothetical protein A33M_3662 [Rhodovulum sp. PH10]